MIQEQSLDEVKKLLKEKNQEAALAEVNHYYYVIPVHVALDKNLCVQEKYLLSVINSLDNDEHKHCYATNSYLEKCMGMKKRQLQNYISMLEKKGKIEVGFNDQNKRFIKSKIKK